MDFKERYQYNPKNDLLGKGGFARVFKAYDQVLNRYVALKVFSVEVSGKYDLVSEIGKVIALEHPNLCRYFDVAFVDGVTTMGEEEKLQVGIMEYLDSGDLKNYCRAHPEQQIKLLTDVLRGLAFLHKRGIIHRDLTPQNILIKNTEDGPVAKITDFGISKKVGARPTSSSLLMGTIEYMAPEQFNPAKYGIKGEIGTNLDLWSFGLMVYELVTGESMFGTRGGKSSAEQVMSNILNDELIEDKIADLQEPYLSVVKLCLVKDAKKRVQSAEELIAFLEGGKTYIPQAPMQNETIFLPKQVRANAETERLPQRGNNKNVSPGEPPTDKKKSGSKSFTIITALTILAVLAGGFWWWQQHSKAFNKLYPVMDQTTTKWGYADSTGKLIVPYIYDWADSMFSGMARINSNKEFGYVDSTGKLVVEPKYIFSFRFSGGWGRVIINGNGALIDKNGNVVAPVNYAFVSDFFEDMASVKINNKYGYIDNTGKVIIPAKYNEAGKFSEGLAPVKLNAKYGFIDKTGKVVIPFDYDFADNFSEGLASVELNKKQGYIDKIGNIVIPLMYDSPSDYNVENFSEGLAAVNINQKCGYVDKFGNEVIPLKYDGAYRFSEDMASVYLNGKYGYINKTGILVIPFKYDSGGEFSEGLVEVYLNGKYGYIDKTGNVVIPIKYDIAYHFSEGLARVQLNNKSGFIDKTGSELISIKYDKATDFSHGVALIKFNGKEGVIDKTGKELIELQ